MPADGKHLLAGPTVRWQRPSFSSVHVKPSAQGALVTDHPHWPPPPMGSGLGVGVMTEYPPPEPSHDTFASADCSYTSRLPAVLTYPHEMAVTMGTPDATPGSGDEPPVVRACRMYSVPVDSPGDSAQSADWEGVLMTSRDRPHPPLYP